MIAAKHEPDTPQITSAAEEAFAPLVELIDEGQDIDALQAGPVDEIGMILYATINGLAIMVNNGFLDPDRVDALVENAVAQFLRGTAPS